MLQTCAASTEALCYWRTCGYNTIVAHQGSSQFHLNLYLVVLGHSPNHLVSLYPDPFSVLCHLTPLSSMHPVRPHCPSVRLIYSSCPVSPHSLCLLFFLHLECPYFFSCPVNSFPSSLTSSVSSSGKLAQTTPKAASQALLLLGIAMLWDIELQLPILWPHSLVLLSVVFSPSLQLYLLCYLTETSYHLPYALRLHLSASQVSLPSLFGPGNITHHPTHPFY